MTIDKQAQRLRNYLDTAHKSGVKLLHLSTDELEGLLDELTAAKKYIAELRDWNVGLAQESFTHQQRVAELEARDINIKRQAQALFEAIANPDDCYIPAYVRCLREALKGNSAGIGKGE